MNNVKSQPKFSFTLKRYENFLPQKNWNEINYMDTQLNQQKEVLEVKKKTKQLTRSKVSLSMHQKANNALSDTRKFGLLHKSNSNLQRGQNKIGYISTLPPIKNQTQQTQNYLFKLKTELNETCLKNLKFEKQIKSVEASLKQVKTKIQLYQSVLNNKNNKYQQELEKITKQICEGKYNEDVRNQMKENLKKVLQAHFIKKDNLEKKLKKVKFQFKTNENALIMMDSDNNQKKYVKNKFQKMEGTKSQSFHAKTTLAQSKLNSERKADDIHQKLQKIQDYDQQTFDCEINFKKHNQSLKQLRVQLFIHSINSILLQKHQLKNQKLQQSYALIKMYSLLNSHQSREGPLVLRKNNLENQTCIDGTVNISVLYSQTFETKKVLEQKISENEKKVKELKQKNELLFKRWVSQTFQDQFNNGDKEKVKKTDFSQEIKSLYRKEEEMESKQQSMVEIDMWIQKQSDKLGIKVEEKLSSSLLSIMKTLHQRKQFMMQKNSPTK